MNIKQTLRSFLAKLCEKNYAAAESLLRDVVTEKVTKRIKDEHDKVSDAPSKKTKEKKSSKTPDMNDDGKIDNQDEYLSKKDKAIKRSMSKKKK
jgi:hypothetical protein